MIKIKNNILEYLAQFGSANRKTIETLLMDKLPDIFDTEQKKTKIGNLLTALRIANKIINQGSMTKPNWVISY